MLLFERQMNTLSAGMRYDPVFQKTAFAVCQSQFPLILRTTRTNIKSVAVFSDKIYIIFRWFYEKSLEEWIENMLNIHLPLSQNS